jgi:hypothetical protein
VPEPEAEIRHQQLDLTGVVLPRLPVQSLLQQNKLYDLTVDMAELGLEGGFRVLAGARGLECLCVMLDPSSMRGHTSVFDSPSFPVACKCAVFLVGVASDELAAQAKANMGKLQKTTIMKLEPNIHKWFTLAIVEDEDTNTRCLVWGLSIEVADLGVKLMPKSSLN